MRPFSQVDVFTDTLTLGNPVAVVHGADGLGEDRMAAFARWTNLSETTFLLPPTDPAADYRLRIFTPGSELPFAGHPTLGSARAWLDTGGRPHVEGQLVQECAAGLIRLRRDGDRLAFAAPPLVRSGPVDTDAVDRLSAAFGLHADEVTGAQWVDNGPGWVALLLKDAQTVLALAPTTTDEFPDVGVVGPYPEGEPVAFEVRAFAGGVGIAEDPVTGSLNAGLAQWLIGSGLAPVSYVAAQGTSLGRRGRIFVDQVGDDIWVGGDTVVGVTGTVEL